MLTAGCVCVCGPGWRHLTGGVAARGAAHDLCPLAPTSGGPWLNQNDNHTLLVIKIQIIYNVHELSMETWPFLSPDVASSNNYWNSWFIGTFFPEERWSWFFLSYLSSYHINSDCKIPYFTGVVHWCPPTAPHLQLSCFLLASSIYGVLGGVAGTNIGRVMMSQTIWHYNPFNDPSTSNMLVDFDVKHGNGRCDNDTTPHRDQ